MAKIGIIDSGVGGFCLLPYLYGTGHTVTCLVDDKNAPYGNKSHADLVGICSKNVNRLFDDGADVVVIMCNTLSSVCREVWHDKTAVVAVEPALNLLHNYKGKRCALICTNVTAQSIGVKKWQKHLDFDVIPLTSLAGIIDALAPDKERIAEYLQGTLAYLANYDVVVLGCTHYSYAIDVFHSVFPSVTFVDGTEGTFARVIELVGRAEGEKFELSIRTSTGGNMYKLYEVVKKLKKI